MGYAHLIGQTLAVILWSTDEAGEDEAAYFTGTVIFADNAFAIDHSPDAAPFPIAEEWLARIEPISDTAREIFPQSAYTLSLEVGDLPPGTDPNDVEDTGLQWPKRPPALDS